MFIHPYLIEEHILSTSSVVGDMSTITLVPASWTGSVSGSGTPTWTWTNSNNWPAVSVGFLVSPPQPIQPSPNWPSMKVEAAFGWNPGDLTGAMPTARGNFLHLWHEGETPSRVWKRSMPEGYKMNAARENGRFIAAA